MNWSHCDGGRACASNTLANNGCQLAICPLHSIATAAEAQSVHCAALHFALFISPLLHCLSQCHCYPANSLIIVPLREGAIHCTKYRGYKQNKSHSQLATRECTQSRTAHLASANGPCCWTAYLRKVASSATFNVTN